MSVLQCQNDQFINPGLLLDRPFIHRFAQCLHEQIRHKCALIRLQQILIHRLLKLANLTTLKKQNLHSPINQVVQALWEVFLETRMQDTHRQL